MSLVVQGITVYWATVFPVTMHDRSYAYLQNLIPNRFPEWVCVAVTFFGVCLTLLAKFYPKPVKQIEPHPAELAVWQGKYKEKP